MDILVKTTFAIILIFSLLNFFFNLYLHSVKVGETTLYKFQYLFWLSLIINFILQGTAQMGQWKIISSFGFGVVPMTLLAQTTYSLFDQTFNWKRYTIFYVLLYIVSFVLNAYDFNFTIVAIPISLAVALPLMAASCLVLVKNRKSATFLHKIKGWIMVLFIIHCFNFAFFRMDVSAQMWGWPVAYALYQILASILPALSLENFHIEENARLNNLVIERTKELAESNEKLKYSLDVNNLLLKVIIHDISNPLTIISYRIKKLRDILTDSDNELVRKYIDHIMNSCFSIQNIIFQAKDYESVRSGKKILQIKAVSLMESVNKVLHNLEIRLKEKNITVRVNTGGESDFLVKIDPPSFVNSVLLNLLSNAIKFSFPEGIIDINIFKIKGDDLNKKKDVVKFEIIDHGVGIPKDVIPNLFSFNFQTNREGTAGESGTGFGLPIVKKYIDLYEGEIFVDSLSQEEGKENYKEEELFTKVTLLLNC